MNTPQAAPLRRTPRLLASLLPAALTLLLLWPAPPTLAAPPATGVVTETGQLLTSLSPPTPASGSYDFQFQLFNAATGGTQVGATQSLAALPVVDGVFYAEINFGAVVGTPGLYLQTSYRVAGTTAYTVQSPRKLLPQSGYADYATEAGYAATAGTATSAATAKSSDSTKALLTKSLSAAVPTTGQVLTYNGTLWAPATSTTGGAYTAGAGLTLMGSQFSVATGGVTGAMLALPLVLSVSSSAALLSATNAGGDGLDGTSASGYGVYGVSSSSYGVRGDTSVAGSSGVAGANSATGDSGALAGSVSGITAGVLGSSGAGYGGRFQTAAGVDGVYGESDGMNGNGGYFTANSGTQAYGVYGVSASGRGVVGNGATTGTYGTSATGIGVYGSGGATGLYGISAAGQGGYFLTTSGVNGLYSESDKASGTGVYGSGGGTGVVGSGGTTGVIGSGGTTGVSGSDAANGDSGLLGGVETADALHSPVGVFGSDATSGVGGDGVFGASVNGSGVYGTSTTGTGGNFFSNYAGATSIGLRGVSGLVGSCYSGNGVLGFTDKGVAVFGVANSNSGYAGYFEGNVVVTGAISAGVKDFRIDHPLDPAGKFLVHASVESDKMEDVYHGHVLLDAQGEATVQMPDWFQALNADCEYTLTCVGGYAPVYVAQEVTDNRFRIAGGRPGLKVSWQVTGVRHDAFALAHPMEVEPDKSDTERGRYLHPVENGQPESLGLGRAAPSSPAPARMP